MKEKPQNSSSIAHNLLAAGTLVKGNIIAEEDFRVDGKVEGQIECAGKLVIGLQAEVIGDIHCQNIDLLGKVNGNIVARDLLSIKSSGAFSGEIIASRLEIEAGSVMNGQVKMQG